MTINRGLGGANRNITSQYRGLSGVNRAIKEQYRGLGGVNRKIFGVSSGILYINGDLCTAVTGGWEVKSLNTNYSFATTTALSMTNNTGGWISEYPVNIIDVTAYSKLKITISARNRRVEFGLNASKIASPGSPVASLNVSATGTFEIDISAITGSYYVYISTDYPSSSTSSISKVWLE